MPFKPETLEFERSATLAEQNAAGETIDPSDFDPHFEELSGAISELYRATRGYALANLPDIGSHGEQVYVVSAPLNITRYVWIGYWFQLETIDIANKVISGPGLTAYYETTTAPSGNVRPGDRWWSPIDRTERTRRGTEWVVSDGSTNLQFTTKSISTDTTLTEEVAGALILVDATGGNLEITLPSSAKMVNKRPVIVRKVDVSENTVTVKGGATDKVLEAQGDVIAYRSSGPTWSVEYEARVGQLEDLSASGQVYLTSNREHADPITRYSVYRGQRALTPKQGDRLVVNVHQTSVTATQVHIRLTNDSGVGAYYEVRALSGGGSKVSLDAVDAVGVLWQSSAILDMQFDGTYWIIYGARLPIGTGGNRLVQTDASGRIPSAIEPLRSIAFASFTSVDPLVASDATNLNVVRASAGVYNFTFVTPPPDAEYVILPSVSGARGVTIDWANKSAAGFVIRTSAADASAIDAIFDVVVMEMIG